MLEMGLGLGLLSCNTGRSGRRQKHTEREARKRGEGGRQGEKERARETITFRNRSDLFKRDHSGHWEERGAQRPTPGLSNRGSLFLPVEQ